MGRLRFFTLLSIILFLPFFVNAQTTIFSDGFETDKGWTLQGEFERSAPQGLGNVWYGEPDPSSAYDENSIIGTDLNINGLYEANVTDDALSATSPVINCSNYTEVTLEFQRWLNVQQPAFDQAYIEISTDGGSSWDIIWENTQVINDNSWNTQSFDISTYADNESTVQLRFRIESNGWWQYSGWNIDELTITGNMALEPNDVYYSYQSGNWNDADTWTTDPSGTTLVGNAVPGDGDKVVILDGRTVAMSQDVSTADLFVELHSNGVIDQSTYQFTSQLAELSGTGTLKLASTHFPDVVNNEFVGSDGGTTEYYNSTDFTLPSSQGEYNHLRINAQGITATQLSNITLNGNLSIKQGTYRINDNTSTSRLNLDIHGNVNVESGANLTVGQGPTNTTTNPDGITGGSPPYIDYYEQFHRVVIYGDFTNHGTVRFTNLDYPVFDEFPPTTAGSTSGAASVYFKGATHNRLQCNNTTDFYNLVLDKGVDQTYSLTVYSSAYDHFRLFGANISGGDQDGSATGENPNLKKALWIRTGTLKLDGLAIIPSLSEGGGSGDPNSDFYIPANGALVLDGPEVVVLSSADRYEEVNVAYNVSGGTGNVHGVNAGVYASSFSILGNLEINQGYFSTRESGGFITWSDASGKLIINGGHVDAKQFRSAGSSGGLAAFRQTGGTFLLRGRFQRTPTQYNSVEDLKDFSINTLNTNRSTNGLNGTLGTFNLNEPENAFFSSGGTIRIYDVCGNNADGAFEVFSDPANINVTGGTLEMIPTPGSGGDDATQFNIETTAPLDNLTINRNGSSTEVSLSTYGLTVLDDLSLQSGVFNANDLDVKIRGDFSLANGTTYSPGSNWTIFEGNDVQSLIMDLSSALDLNKFKIDKPEGSNLQLEGSQNVLHIADSAMIIEGGLHDNGKTIQVEQSLYNSGVHTGAGRIVLNADSDQAIDGDGTGVFGNLELNKPSSGNVEVILKSNTTIEGALIFSGASAGYKKFNIGANNLHLGPDATVAGAGENRFIFTNGEVGNRSVTKDYTSASSSFTFPVGAPSPNHGDARYTPATIGFSSDPTTYGSVTVVPVGMEHPTVSVSGQSLTYYWRVKANGFSGIPSGAVTHSFQYRQSDVAGIETNYQPAIYEAGTYTWHEGSTGNPPIDPGNNTIADWSSPSSSGNYLEGDYTAGDNAFGDPQKFYSVADGYWGDASTWSNTSGGSGGAGVPDQDDVVIIENNHTVQLEHNGSDYPMNFDVRSCASLQIEEGSVLDIKSNTASDFGIVLSDPDGNGLLRLTTEKAPSNGDPQFFSFPSGDFTDFNVNGGTTEYYDIDGEVGALYILPPDVDSYGNLVLSAKGGDNIVLPNNNYTTIHGDLTCSSVDNSTDAWIVMAWNTDIWPYNNNDYNPVLKKTVEIKGNLYVNAGSFMFLNNEEPQHLIVREDVVIDDDAVMEVYPDYPFEGPVANTLEIGGSLINNNIAEFREAGGGWNPQIYYVNVFFTGEEDASVTNTSGNPQTTFNELTVDKGNSQSSTLTMDIGGNLDILTDDWLHLKNGTLEYMRSGDFTITEESPFNIPSTAGLYLDTPSDVLIANDRTNNNDVYLSGKLTLIQGNVTIGATWFPNRNNDIEYSAGGNAELDIQGGALRVNGQIRRNVNTDAGVLTYRQSGGNVTINGRNANTSNAKLEILNEDSRFDMSGGSLHILLGGGGETYGDLYLRPGNSSVTGGEILFSQGSNTFQANYRLDANVPLYDLTINGTNGENAEVQLLVSPLELKGDLTLTNTQSILDANPEFNIDVTIRGDFNHSGVYRHYENTTIFDGDAQAITGSSEAHFYDMTVSSLTSLTLNGQTTIANHLILSNGTLQCGSYRVNVRGDFTNNATYTDSQHGVVLNGSDQQYIDGTGTFGRLELDNSNGARIGNDLTLQKNLVLSSGIFDINEHLLTLGENSEIEGAPFSDTKMITSEGVLSNVGIKKIFGTYSGAAQTFLYPLGTSGKYTPVELTYTQNNNVGFIRLNNINSHHPSVVDENNVLDYYWEVESSAISGFDGEMLMHYKETDVRGSREDEYIAARLLVPGDSWSKAATGSTTDDVDENNNTITYSFSGTDNLSGEYTAGLSDAIPDNVPEFTSTDDGNWNEPDNWVQTGGDDYTLSGGPNGFKVVIDHNIDLNNNFSSAYRITIHGQLNVIEPYYGHNLGKVQGEGVLYLEDGRLPAGRYEDFLDCSGNGTLEYGGSGDYTIVGDLLSSIPNIHFTGTGTRILPNKDLTICQQFLIDGVTVDNSVSNRMLTIQGTIERYNGGSFISGSGPDAVVRFAGMNAQDLGGPLGDFTGSNAFHHLEVDNPDGLTIEASGAIDVAGKLYLSDGLISTSSSDNLTIINTSVDCVVPSEGNANSYVDGPLTKRINQGDHFLFPVGKDDEIGNQLTLASTQTGTQLWTVEYFYPNSTAADKASPLSYVNADSYWKVSGPTDSKSIIKLNWNDLSDLTPLMTQNGLSDMRVARYSTSSSEWEELSSDAIGNDYEGTVYTTSRVTIPSDGNSDFTVACVNAVKPRAKLDPDGPVCGAQGIPVSFTATESIPFDYVLDYTLDGVDQPDLTISSGELPYTLPTPQPGEYELTSFHYADGGELGVVDANTVTVYDNPTSADAGGDQNLCGANSTTLQANTATVGSGVWTIVSGTGGTVVNPTDPQSDFLGTNGSTYTLRWTITNGACTSSDEVTISFPLLPVQPDEFTQSLQQVCEGQQDVTYSVPNDPSVSYNWNYTGTGATITGSGNSVTIDFEPGATSGDLEVTATNDCGISDPRTIAITVNDLPTADAGPDLSVCYPNSIELSASGGITYNWTPGTYLDDPDENQTPTLTPTTEPGSSPISITYTVEVINSIGCIDTDDVKVTIYKVPETGSIYHVPNNFDQN